MPGSTCDGSQGKSGVGLYGPEPSSVLCSPPPGQRLFWPVVSVAWSAAARSSGGISSYWPAPPAPVSANALAWMPTREAAPSAS